MTHRFPSLAEPDLVYVVTDCCEFRDYSRNSLSDQVGCYRTLGDGDVQHTPLCQVTVSNFADFCASTVDHILTGPPGEADTLGRVIASILRHYDVTYDRVKAAAGIKFKDGKRQWYETGSLKISSSDSKRHDRRWNEVAEWHDGSFRAAARVIECFSGTMLLVWSKLYDARDLWNMVTGDHAPYPDVLLDLGLPNDLSNEAHAAFTALKAIGNSYQSKIGAERALECYKHNVDNRRKRNPALV